MLLRLTRIAACTLAVLTLLLTAGPVLALTRDVFDAAGATSLCPNNTSVLVQVDLLPTVDGPSGVNETGVEFRTITGWATIEVFGSDFQLSSSIFGSGGCTTSDQARVTIRFVDMNAPGFNAGNPATWTYRRIPWLTVSASGDGITPTPPSLVQVRAFRDIGQSGLIGSCSGGCQFTDPLGQGIGELAWASNNSESVLDNLILRITEPAATPVGTNVTVTSGVATMTFPSVTGAGVSGTFEFPANPIATAFPGGFFNCSPTRFYTLESTATAGVSNRTVCIHYPDSCNETGIALYHFHQVGWTGSPPFQTPLLGWDNVTTTLDTSLNRICAGPVPPNGFAVSFQPVNSPFAVVSTNPPCGTERCDGVDNDCDAQIDEGFNVGSACSSGIGQCARPGNLVCSADGLSSVCNAVPGAPTTELCNGLDDDCDNAIDDGFPVGNACTVGVGQCARSGNLVCNIPGTGTICSVVPGTPTAEVCNGLDDDCDGTPDDGNPGGGASCSTGLLGVCAAGAMTCSSGSLSCAQTVFPSTELCNSLDDDCDGSTDEGASDAPVWYRDADGDGFGSSTVTLAQCQQPAGYVANSSDCDDADPLLQNCNTPVSPGPVTFEAPGGAATVELPNVVTPGQTTITSSACTAPAGIFVPPDAVCVQIETTATFDGNAEVCIHYSDTGLSLAQEQALRMVRYPDAEGCALEGRPFPCPEGLPTTGPLPGPPPGPDTDLNILCAETDAFSEFAVGSLTDVDSDFVQDIFDNCPTVVNFFQEDADSDGSGDVCDNCRTLANVDQADGDADAAGNACDSCAGVSNPRVAADFLAANPWATLTGGQRDDDHDGYGNRCDAKFPGVAGTVVGAGDLVQMRISIGKGRITDTCGTTGTRPCAIFDLDESAVLIGAPDLAVFRQLSGKQPGPKCATCPLACEAGASGSCGAIP